MKFQIPSFKIFLNRRTNAHTHTHTQTSRKQYAPHFFKVGGIKIYKAELWFLCMTHRLIVLYNCMKFHLNSFGCQLTEWTRNTLKTGRATTRSRRLPVL